MKTQTKKIDKIERMLAEELYPTANGTQKAIIEKVMDLLATIN